MDKSGAKQKKEAKDEKQKDQKIEEQVLKLLDEETPTSATPEEKFSILLRKHVESERAARRLRQEMKAQEKQLETVLREKENLQREYNKSVLMRDKLQEVCREQQKLIKSVKNESIQKIREEEERRKESQSKFQTSLNEITQSLSKNNEENIKLRDHNIDMTKKMKMLAEQYHMREQQLEKLNEQVQLESQLHQAKLNKVQVEAAMEKEILTKEKQIALEKFVQSQKMLKELAEREAALKEQLNLYTAKYDDFQSSLQKSNDIFATYKVELERMAKNTRKLEKETLEWKTKWEKSNAILIELATEKKERDDHAIRCSKQVEQLQKLLRALQNERTHLYKVLRDNDVECPPMPVLPPEPEPIQTTPLKASGSSDKDKMDMMTRNCAELKQTLANLQNQMKFLNKGSGSTEAQTSPAPAQTKPQQQQQQQQEESNKKRQRKKQKSKNNKNAKELTPTPELTSIPVSVSASKAFVASTVAADASAEATETSVVVNSAENEGIELPVTQPVEAKTEVKEDDTADTSSTTESFSVLAVQPESRLESTDSATVAAEASEVISVAGKVMDVPTDDDDDDDVPELLDAPAPEAVPN